MNSVSGLRPDSLSAVTAIRNYMIHNDALVDQWKTHSDGVAFAGRAAQPGDWSISRNIFVAETSDKVKHLARNSSRGECIQCILDRAAGTSPGGLQMWKLGPEMPDAGCNLDYFMDHIIIAGDPEHVTNQLFELREGVGAYGKLVRVAHDRDDRQRWLHNLELFGGEVKPTYNQTIGASLN